MIDLLLIAHLTAYPPHLCNELIETLVEAVELETINEQEANVILENCFNNATKLAEANY
tara:strand:+ start:327 stop:503 length:177 start_codon:yes stop_codon:yes gene_type:complete